jgi:hypothetical protein
VPPQFNVAEVAPLMTMAFVEPEAVNVAEPVTVQFVFNGEFGQLTVTDLVTFVPVAVNEIVPGTVVIDPPEVMVKV